MALIFNGTQVKTVIFNGTQLKKIIKDGVVVFQSGITINFSYKSNWDETYSSINISASTPDSDAMLDTDTVQVEIGYYYKHSGGYRAWSAQAYVTITKANPSVSKEEQFAYLPSDKTYGLRFYVNGTLQKEISAQRTTSTVTGSETVEL